MTFSRLSFRSMFPVRQVSLAVQATIISLLMPFVVSANSDPEHNLLDQWNNWLALERPAFTVSEFFYFADLFEQLGREEDSLFASDWARTLRSLDSELPMEFSSKVINTWKSQNTSIQFLKQTEHLVSLVTGIERCPVVDTGPLFVYRNADSVDTSSLPDEFANRCQIGLGNNSQKARAWLLWSKGELRRSLDLFRDAIGESNHPRERFILAEMIMRASGTEDLRNIEPEFFSEAKTIMGELISADPTSARYQSIYSRLLWFEGRRDQALESLVSALNKGIARPQWKLYWRLGTFFKWEGKDQEAEPYFRYASEAVIRHGSACNWVCDSYRSLNGSLFPPDYFADLMNETKGTQMWSLVMHVMKNGYELGLIDRDTLVAIQDAEVERLRTEVSITNESVPEAIIGLNAITKSDSWSLLQQTSYWRNAGVNPSICTPDILSYSSVFELYVYGVACNSRDLSRKQVMQQLLQAESPYSQFLGSLIALEIKDEEHRTVAFEIIEPYLLHHEEHTRIAAQALLHDVIGL